MRQRRQRPREVEREVELVSGVLVVGEPDDRVLETEQHPRVDLEREVEVDRSFAALLGVQVDLPRLAERVALDEVTLVVHVEAVLDRVVLEIGDEPGYVDDGHSVSLLEGARTRAIRKIPSAERSARTTRSSPRRPPSSSAGIAKKPWIMPS